MPAFSRRLGSACAPLACFLTASCWQADLHDENEAPPLRPEIRVAHPIDPGDEGQSRDLLQHYIARDHGAPESRIPDGPALEREAVTWELPFKSKRIAAALLTTVARDRLEDLPLMLHRDATWGVPDPRRIQERSIFAKDGGKAFIEAFRRAARRFPENATYKNPSNFVMGLQEHIRSGSEPMWAYYEQDADRILFRFRALGGRAWIDYVGFYRDAPTTAPNYDALGPAPPMSPAVRKEDGTVMHDARPRPLPQGRDLPPRPGVPARPQPGAP